MEVLDMSDERVYSEDEIKNYLSDKLPHWFYENGWIRRKYKTSGWKGTLMVINTVGHLAETFKEVNGVRYSFPGDYAKLEEDGTITLLGRGSNCINSAGEKIYPEEVEEAIKRNDEVFDCLVVGVDDKKFGQKVVAVVSLEPNKKINEELLVEATRSFIAGYKLPKKKSLCRWNWIFRCKWRI